MAQKSLTREEGVYTLVDGHFAIDCACGGEDISFRNHLQENNDFEQNYRDSSSTRVIEAPKHTFYINNIIVGSYLDTYHRKEEGDEPLVIICKSCKNELPLTYESSRGILKKLMN